MTINERIRASLQGAGIPAFPIVWRPTQEYPVKPATYATYQRLTSVPELSADNRTRLMVHYMRVTIHGNRDPTDTVRAARGALECDGFAIGDERDESDVDADEYYIVLRAAYYEDY